MCCSVRSMLLAVVLLLIGCENADAVVCTPLNEIKRYVGITDPGNPNFDPLCTDNDVNSAIAYIAGLANTCPAAIYITHEHEADHVAQHIVFDNTNRSITLVGLDHGIACGSSNPQICESPPCPAPTTPLLTLDAYSTSGSVIHIDGQNNVALLNLTVQHGAAAYNANGGGIYFSGSGTLGLTNSVVQSNYAGYGGGIYFNGNGGNATLTLDTLTLIIGNEAQFSGGGIRVDGTARLFALQDQTILFNNKADGYDPVAMTVAEGYGGGLEIVGPARADIGSSGYNGLGVIYLNKALYGGGAAIFGDNNAENNGILRIFTVNAQHPVQIQSNTATSSGGGVFLRSNVSPSDDGILCAYDFRMDDNIAPDGTAIYADSDSDIEGFHEAGWVGLNTDVGGFCTTPELPTALGAVACASGTVCNSVDGNIAEDSQSQPTNGSTINIQPNGDFQVDRLIMRYRSRAGHAILEYPGDEEYDISNCLIADNQVTSDLIMALNGDADVTGNVTLSDCTVTNNTIGGSVTTIGGGVALQLSDSIIYQPGVPSFTGDKSQVTASYVISDSASVLPVGIGVISAEPAFVNPAGGDYHLRPESIGVDYAPADGSSDLDRLPRDVDLGPVPNVYGPRDVGAFERQYLCAADTIYCDSFEHYQ